MKGFFLGLVTLSIILGGTTVVTGQETADPVAETPVAEAPAAPLETPATFTPASTSTSTSTPTANAQANPETTPTPGTTTSGGSLTEGGFSTFTSGWDMVKAVGAFILVMVLLVLTLKGLGRLSRFRGIKGGNAVFTYRGIQALDNRKYLAAVEIEGRIIVVGVTPERITPVAHWFLNNEDDGLEFFSTHGSTKETEMDFILPERDLSDPCSHDDFPDIRVAPRPTQKQTQKK